MQRVLGAIFSPKDIRDYRIKKADMAQEFPEEFELELPNVKNQGSVGSCVAHAIATTIEYHDRDLDPEPKSVGYIYGNRRMTTHLGIGLVTRDALKTTCQYGDVSFAKFPYNREVPKVIEEVEKVLDDLSEDGELHRFKAYYKLSSVDEVKTSLMTSGPVIFAMNWYSDMFVNEDGVLKSRSDFDIPYKQGGHCMVIYGWNKQGWKIRNSWGKSWGVKGNAILPYDSPIKELWGITDDENTPLIKPFTTKIGRWFAKVFNTICLFFYKIFYKG